MRNPAITVLVMGWMVALSPNAVRAAGETSARPQVKVTPPPNAGKEGVEPDDLPGPPLEVVTAPAKTQLPAIPDFGARADGRVVNPIAPAEAVAVVTEAPQRKVVSIYARNLSVDSLNKCNEAITARRYKAAVGACRAAIAAWKGNHLAWYGAGNAHMGLDEWTLAAASIEQAVTLRPDLAMYQMTYGIALYEAELARARQERAHKAEKADKAEKAEKADKVDKPQKPQKPERDAEPSLDSTVLKLDAARAALVRATTLEPKLWRAHAYLGYLYRDLRDPRAAAEEMTTALRDNPGDRTSYVALAELYRRWGFHQQALMVAIIGTANVRRDASADLWFEVAMCYEMLNDDNKAIEALGKGLEIAPESVVLKLHRGRLNYGLHRGQLAKRDLEPVASNSDPKMASAREAAEVLLERIAGGVSPQAAYRTCKAVNGCKIFKDPFMQWLTDDWSSL